MAVRATFAPTQGRRFIAALSGKAGGPSVSMYWPAAFCQKYECSTPLVSLAAGGASLTSKAAGVRLYALTRGRQRRGDLFERLALGAHGITGGDERGGDHEKGGKHVAAEDALA